MAFAFGLSMTVLWWFAALNQWAVTIVYDRFNEHWAEGLIFHLALLSSVLMAPYLFRRWAGSR